MSNPASTNSASINPTSINPSSANPTSIHSVVMGLPGLDRIAFHNVAELERAAGYGVHLRRVPRSVRGQLNERGRFIAGEAGGCELRFFTPAPNIRVTLTLPETDGSVTVYKGGLFHSRHELQAGTIRTLQLTEPPRLAMAERGLLMAAGFPGCLLTSWSSR